MIECVRHWLDDAKNAGHKDAKGERLRRFPADKLFKLHKEHREEFATAVGQDLRRIYFDLTPSDRAKVIRKKDRFVFKQKNPDETVRFTFSGPRRLLTEKKISKGWKTRSIVRYFDYKEQGGRLYPQGIILYNKAFHYRMVLRVKEIIPVNEAEMYENGN